MINESKREQLSSLGNVPHGDVTGCPLFWNPEPGSYWRTICTRRREDNRQWDYWFMFQIEVPSFYVAKEELNFLPENKRRVVLICTIW